MATFVLRNGLAGAALRPLARAAGTSDRILIHHFATKDALVAALLAHLAQDFQALMAQAIPGDTFASVDDAVARLGAPQMHTGFADYIRLWLEIVAAAGRGSVAHRQTGAAIQSGLASWLEGRHPEADRPATPEAIVRIEGAMVLWSLGLDARLSSDIAEHPSLQDAVTFRHHRQSRSRPAETGVACPAHAPANPSPYEPCVLCKPAGASDFRRAMFPFE